MSPMNRRAFCCDVSRSMLAAGLGTALAENLGLSTSFASEPAALPLGEHTALVELMRSTPADMLQPLLARKLVRGETNLKQLTAAGALANAVTFGGCDYVGFHTAMAMLPALAMSAQMPAGREPLPVLKVLYRNAQQIQNVGGALHTELTDDPVAEPQQGDVGLQIRDACRGTDGERGERLLAHAKQSSLDAFHLLQPAIQDDLNVHRFVFAHRTYGLVGLLGENYSYSILRQCVRLCADHERMRIEHKQPESPIRALMPRLIDQYKLANLRPGRRDPGEQAVEALANEIYQGPRDRAAEAAAAALSEGIDPEIVGEAISLASNLYVLRQGADKWRTHGDSAGVHSSDATNAWRNMARIALPSQAITGLVVAAYHAGVQSAPFTTPAYPTDEHQSLVRVTEAPRLLAETEDAIRQNDQGRATAAIQCYGERGYPVDPVFQLMLKYAVSEDGRLHGEKYYHTVQEEYSTTRPAFRWRHIVGLARVTASAYGYNRDDQQGFRAAGYDAACHLLGVES